MRVDSLSQLLNSSCAEFVDIIHTDTQAGLGLRDSIGHVDFYPNGGSWQPGCLGFILFCSHSRSSFYFLESIGSNVEFYAYPCSSYVKFKNGECKTDPIPMGENTPHSARGEHFLFTSDEEPYAEGKL